MKETTFNLVLIPYHSSIKLKKVQIQLKRKTFPRIDISQPRTSITLFHPVKFSNHCLIHTPSSAPGEKNPLHIVPAILRKQNLKKTRPTSALIRTLKTGHFFVKSSAITAGVASLSLSLAALARDICVVLAGRVQLKALARAGIDIGNKNFNFRRVT